MAPTLEECDAMIQATQKAGVKFMIAETDNVWGEVVHYLHCRYTLVFGVDQ
jgi:predicted dehydrogenase